MKNYIKISIILCLTLLLASCTSMEMDEYFEGYASKNSITLESDNLNPPSWIKGTWSDAKKENYYRFTTNDLIKTTYGESTSFYDLMPTFDIKSESNSEIFKILTVSYNEPYDEHNWVYTKISDTEINCQMFSNDELIYSENLTLVN